MKTADLLWTGESVPNAQDAARLDAERLAAGAAAAPLRGEHLPLQNYD